MRILFDAGHPAHVHFFKNIAWNLMRQGHNVKITARDKEVTLDLLRKYGFEFENRGEIYTGLLDKALGMVRIDLRLYRIARRFDPDILIGVHNPYIAHVSRLLHRPSIIFNDTEGVRIARMITYPFADVICTPSCFLEAVPDGKHVSFNGYKEIAYLHPRYFQPDIEVLTEAGLSPSERIIVLRFISWAASHDIGLTGIRRDRVLDVIRKLEEYGRVVITSEGGIDSTLEKYRLKIPPEKMHSLLYHAALYMGEGGTMAAEAAILGTPAIHIESDPEGRPTGERSGNFRELRDRYHLLYFFADQREALSRAIEILEEKDSKREWQKRRERLLSEKIDVTEWFTDFIVRYPESFREYKAGKGERQE